MLAHYFTFAYRNLVRNKLHTLINIVGLGLGLMCFVGAYLFVDYTRSFESQFENSDRIYTIYAGTLFGGIEYPPSPYVSILLAEYIAANFPDVEAIVRTSAPFEGVVSTDGEESYLRIRRFDPDLFKMFDLTILAGETEDPFGQPGSAVITAEAAEALFGTHDVVGRTLTAETTRDLTIVAVMSSVSGASLLGKSFLEASDGAFDLMVRYDWNPEMATMANVSLNQREFWFNARAITHVMLPRDGSLTPAVFTTRLQELVDSNLSDEIATITYDTRHVSELPMWAADRNISGGTLGLSITTMLLLLGSMVLAMACLNFTNLATAQAAARGKEVAMRKILGAKRIQVALQYLAEALVTVVFALVFAVVLIQLAVPAINAQLHTVMTIAWLTEWRLWAFLGSVILIVGLVAGFYPAVVLARAKPVQALHVKLLRAGSTSLRTILVGTQFVVASFLMIAVLVMTAQNQSLWSTGLGFADEPRVMITANLDAAGIDMETLRSEMLRGTGVTRFTGTSLLPWSNGSGGLQYARSADETAEKIILEPLFVSYEYFSTMGIEQLAGRPFSRDYASDTRRLYEEESDFGSGTEVNTVINRAAAEALGWANPEDAIGQLIYHRLSEQPIRATRVVGIVETAPFRLVNWSVPAAGLAYYLDLGFASRPIVQVSNTDVVGALEEIDAAWDRLSPDYPIQRHFEDEDFDRAMSLIENINALFIGLAVFAFLIASMGLFSMATYLTNRRTQEIGIRKCLGASSRQILRLLVWDFSKPVLIANILAWPIAFIAVDAYLNMFVDRVPLSLTPFVISLLITTLIAWVAVASQVLLTARVNPAQVLRVE